MLIPSTVDSRKRFGARRLEASAIIRAGSTCIKLPTALISSGLGIATFAFLRSTLWEIDLRVDFFLRESGLHATEPIGRIVDSFRCLFSHHLSERLRSPGHRRSHSEQLARI